MDLKLKGKKAVVTGGTRGIGRAIAETLALEGCDVAICARDAEGVREAVEALVAKGVNATGGVVDVADGKALKAWVTKAGQELGGINILVSNSSGGGGTSDEAWAQTFDVDLMGAVHAVDAAMPFLQEAAAAEGDAAIVIISSVAAAIALDTSSYGPIKAALIHMAKGLAKEGAPKHIRANTISPGAVYFEGGGWHRREQNDPDTFKAVLAACPTGRMATPQDIANAAAFLASPVSSYTTGINLVVDGAFTDRVNF
jgi:3-oxoacyl-[acyl-carrier protein] reductase